MLFVIFRLNVLYAYSESLLSIDVKLVKRFQSVGPILSQLFLLHRYRNTYKLRII